MKVHIFLGPTLPREEARAELEAVYHPPAAQGDVYRAALDQPVAIGIVDGYFERVPSIWHKEILWAMSQGIHVFGGASMGALRAAELAAFGMEGVGAIFEAFRSGAIEDDDEVAVAHADAEGGYRPGSEAMVNVRSTLARAEAEAVIGPATRGALVGIAKELHYTDRTFPAILAAGAARGLAAGDLAALQAFLPEGRVDQKHLDALAMLRALRERLPGLAPKRVTYTFAHTDAWEQVRQQVARETPAAGALEEAQRGALLRALALAEAQRRGLVATPPAVQAAADAFRRARGLGDAKAVRAWLAEQDLDPDGMVALLQEEVLLAEVATALAPEADRHLPGHLRATGEYGEFLRRARRETPGR
jgi:hypothetical protein